MGQIKFHRGPEGKNMEIVIQAKVVRLPPVSRMLANKHNKQHQARKYKQELGIVVEFNRGLDHRKISMLFSSPGKQ